MNMQTLQRMGGLVLIAGAAMLTIWTILWATLLPVDQARSDFLQLVVDPDWRWVAAVSLVGVILMIFGFSALYARIAEESGLIGLIGYVFIVLAYLFQAAKVTWEIFLYPVIADDAAAAFLIQGRVLFDDPAVGLFRLISTLTIFGGIVFFCLALFRGKEFPKTVPALIFSGAFLYGAGPMLHVYIGILGVVILAAGCSLAGYRMYSGES